MYVFVRVRVRKDPDPSLESDPNPELWLASQPSSGSEPRVRLFHDALIELLLIFFNPRLCLLPYSTPHPLLKRSPCAPPCVCLCLFVCLSFHVF